jgi:hypothetical protein
MTTTEVASRFNELAQTGNWNQIQDELFAADAISIEPEHIVGLQIVKGMDAIRQKGVVFNEMIQEVHSGYSNSPQVSGNHFSVAMGMDVTMKGDNRMNIDEIAVYEVKNGKIVKEQFFY